MSKNIDAAQGYASCTLQKHASKIHSSIKFLDPSNTSELELNIINNSEFKIVCLEYEPANDYCICEFQFHIDAGLFNQASQHLPEIHEHMDQKSRSVMKFFPNCRLSKVEVKKLQEEIK